VSLTGSHQTTAISAGRAQNDVGGAHERLPNDFRLCRRRLGALASDSAYDHEILHLYSLPGIIMRACHALISADEDGHGSVSRQEELASVIDRRHARSP